MIHKKVHFVGEPAASAAVSFRSVNQEMEHGTRGAAVAVGSADSRASPDVGAGLASLAGEIAGARAPKAEYVSAKQKVPKMIGCVAQLRCAPDGHATHAVKPECRHASFQLLEGSR
jgi:hypothetical protein